MTIQAKTFENGARNTETTVVELNRVVAQAEELLRTLGEEGGAAAEAVRQRVVRTVSQAKSTGWRMPAQRGAPPRPMRRTRRITTFTTIRGSPLRMARPPARYGRTDRLGGATPRVKVNPRGRAVTPAVLGQRRPPRNEHAAPACIDPVGRAAATSDGGDHVAAQSGRRQGWYGRRDARRRAHRPVRLIESTSPRTIRASFSRRSRVCVRRHRRAPAARRTRKRELRAAAEQLQSQNEATTRQSGGARRDEGLAPAAGRTPDRASCDAGGAPRRHAPARISSSTRSPRTRRRVGQYRAQMAGRGDADLKRTLREIPAGLSKESGRRR